MALNTTVRKTTTSADPLGLIIINEHIHLICCASVARAYICFNGCSALVEADEPIMEEVVACNVVIGSSLVVGEVVYFMQTHSDLRNNVYRSRRTSPTLCHNIAKTEHTDLIQRLGDSYHSNAVQTNPPMLVPAELIDHIFSFLRGDKSALEECSKAHPMFSSIAEPYLYADILIRTDYKTALSELYKQLSENPHILNFPRTFKLEFRRGDGIPSFSPPNPEALLIMSMLPRMANLISLSIADKWPYRLHEDFMSTFKTCLQQSTIEELCLKSFRMFPLSILDGKTIKKLTLSDCIAMSEDEPILTSGSLHQSLETLIIKSYHNPALLLWASRRATSLTTLELRDSYKPHLREFANLLRACSKTLTWLHLDIDARRM